MSTIMYTMDSEYVNNHVHNGQWICQQSCTQWIVDMSTIMYTMDSGYVNNHVHNTLKIGHLLCTLHVKDIVPYTNDRIGE